MTPEEIKSIRKKLGFTQAEMAKLCNTTEDTISSWEIGRREPRGPSIRLLEIIEKVSTKVNQFKADFGRFL